MDKYEFIVSIGSYKQQQQQKINYYESNICIM